MELIYNATIINRGCRYRGYVAVEAGRIAATGEGDAPDNLLREAVTSTDLGGAWLIPGVIDTHVHFRDGGEGSPKGDIASESAAALAGGVTTYFDMPNTVPPTVSEENLRRKMTRAASASKANYAFFIGATSSNFNYLLSAPYSEVPGVKIFMGASTGNMLLDDRSLLSEIFARVPAVKAVHAEDQKLLDANLAAIKAEYPAGGIPVSEHSRWRDTEVCLSATRAAIALAENTGARLHLCHISTAAEASLLTPGAPADKRITAETCPHYLLLSSDDYPRLGARMKCNPAIKSAADSEELFRAIVDGRIDTIATDHAPHLPADKDGDLLKAASGMPGVQFSLRLMIELSLRRPELTLERIVELMCHNPAEIFGIKDRGFIDRGMYADLVAVAQLPSPETITDESVISRCGWTPYSGMKLSTYIKKVWLSGPMPIKFNNRQNS